MNIEDRIADLTSRVEMIEAALGMQKIPITQNLTMTLTQPTPAPHPLEGLQWKSTRPDLDQHWHPADCAFINAAIERYADQKVWRDSTTHAPVPLWQVARRLGVEHPVPPEVRWTDVELDWDNENQWASVGNNYLDFSYWTEVNIDAGKGRRTFRLTAQYDHQPITYAEFRKILAREDKPASEVECKEKSTPAVDPQPSAVPVLGSFSSLFEVVRHVRQHNGFGYFTPDAKRLIKQLADMWERA